MNILQEKENTFIKSQPFGIYVHVPFCASTCEYCNFYQVQPRKGEIKKYLETLRLEFEFYPPLRKADTVFFGGGTPGLLHEDDFAEIADILRPHLAKSFEWTVEMAPSTVKKNKLQVMQDLGVNRISMGIQSFDPKYLDILGRQHSRDKAITAFDQIREVGFENVNIDLIFAVPGQTLSDWDTELDMAFSLNPDHISTYCLIFEEDAALYLKFSKGKAGLSAEEESRLFERTWERMAEFGYNQYEIANYCKPGYQCQHNCNTWRMLEWRGYGPASASQIGNRRFANVHSIDEWAEGVRQQQPVYHSYEELSSKSMLEDSIIFGLRMNEGVSLEQLECRFPDTDICQVKRIFEYWVDEKWLTVNEERNHFFCLTDRGRLIADQLALDLLMEEV